MTIENFLWVLVAAAVPLVVASKTPHSNTGQCLLQVHKDAPAARTALDKSGSEEEGHRGPHVCIIARTCGPQDKCKPGPGDPERIVRAFLTSMAAQTYSSFELHLVNGQGGGGVFTNLVSRLNDKRIISGPDSLTSFTENTWGYEATNYALESLLQGRGTNLACEYFLFASADSVYGRHFLESAALGMSQGKDLLGVNFATMDVQGEALKSWTDRADLPLSASDFGERRIDLGAVLVSAKAIRESGIRFNSAGDAVDSELFEKVMHRPGGSGTAFYNEQQLMWRGAPTLMAAQGPSLQLVSLAAPTPKTDRSTLFYHVHVPRTGGTTVANLLVADICHPSKDHIEWTYEGNDDLCKQECEMGLTDNEMSCFPQRLSIEHKVFSVNSERAERLRKDTRAEKMVYVTTLRRGPPRVKSQWLLELRNNLWKPPEGVQAMSNESFRLYVTGGEHRGNGWGWSVQNPSQRNNLQVAQLASMDPQSDEVVGPEHLEKAKQVLMQGYWLIGFTDCLDKLHESLTMYSESIHGDIAYKTMERKLGDEGDKSPPDAETAELLNKECQWDDALFHWAWELAEAKNSSRFAGTC